MSAGFFGATALTRALSGPRWSAFSAKGCARSSISGLAYEICSLRSFSGHLHRSSPSPITSTRAITSTAHDAVLPGTSGSSPRWGSISIRKGPRWSPTSARPYSTESRETNFGEMTVEEYKKSPHRFKPLTLHEVASIFGPGLTRTQGNHLLDTLQKQRVTGTLDYDVEGPSVTKARIAKALRWLRAQYPLDEDAAIMARIDREEALTAEWRPQQKQQESVLEQRVKEVQEQRLKREQEEIEAAKRDAENNAHLGPKEVAKRGTTPGMAAHVNEKGGVSEWVQKYRERARLSDMEEAPKLSAMQVLGWPTVFTVVTVLLAGYFAVNYKPPSQKARLYPDTPPAAATVGGIIAINMAVLLMWRFPPLYRFMNKNFLLIAATPNPLAMLGSVFSHHTLWHLGANMAGLWFIGTALCDEIGRGNFLALYVASGVMGAWLSLARFVVMGNLTYSTLGASGAVLGIVGAHCALYPSQKITIALLPQEWKEYVNMKAEYLLYTLIFFEVFSVFRGKVASVDHGAHLGGLLTGVAGAEALRRRALARRKSMQERMRASTGS